MRNASARRATSVCASLSERAARSLAACARPAASASSAWAFRADAEEVVEHLRFFHDSFPLTKQKEERANKLLAKIGALERALLDKKGRLPKEGDARTVAMAHAAVRRLNPLIELLRAGQEWHAEQAQAAQK